MGARELVGEPAIPLLERLWARPTFEVHGIRGGFTGEGAKTVIPARAVAKVSTRLVADQQPEEAAAQLREAISAACPKGVTAEFKPIHSAATVAGESGQSLHRTPRPTPWSDVFGHEDRLHTLRRFHPDRGIVRSRPRNSPVMMGFGLPDDNLHAPNEKLHLPNFFRGIEAVARYLEMFGE